MLRMSLEDTLKIQDSILVKGECRDEYKKYIYQLILLFNNKVLEGSLLEAETISKQLGTSITSTQNMKICLSQLLEVLLEVCHLQLYTKQKNKQKQKYYLLKVNSKMPKLLEKQRHYISYKVNCLILYDQSFELFQECSDHPDRRAINYYKKGNFQEAASLLQQSLKNQYMPDFDLMRKVLIGKILLQKQNLSGFSWLNHVIQTSRNCVIQKYEARLLFISGYKILIVQQGKDPELATIPIENILQRCFQYFQNIDLSQTNDLLKKFQQSKQKIIGSIPNRIAYIQKALDQICHLICFPKVSIQELDLRIQLAELLYQQEEYNRCLDQTEKSKTLASQLDIYYWERQLKLSKLSALTYMRLGYYQSVIQLLERVMKIQPDRVQRLKCLQWKLEAEKQRLQQSTTHEQTQESSPINIKVQQSRRSLKSNISSFRSVKSNESSNKLLLPPKKQQFSIRVTKPTALNISFQLQKIRKSTIKAYSFRFKNRSELRESMRNSYDEQPKCCLLF